MKGLPKNIFKFDESSDNKIPSMREKYRLTGGSEPKLVNQFWKKNDRMKLFSAKQWIMKTNHLETTLNEWEKIFLTYRQDKDASHIRFLSNKFKEIIFGIIISTFTTTHGSFLSLQQARKLILHEDPAQYAGTLSLDEPSKKLFHDLFKYYYAAGWQPAAISRDMLRPYLNRLYAYEVIAALLNRHITTTTNQHKSPKVVLLSLLNENMNNIYLLSRKIDAKHLLDLLDSTFNTDFIYRNKRFKNGKWANFDMISLAKSYLNSLCNYSFFPSNEANYRGFYEALTIRIVFGDRPRDLSPNNFLITEQGIVNVDTGNFFQEKYDLHQALHSPGQLLEHILGGALSSNEYADETDKEQFQLLKNFLSHLYTEEQAWNEMLNTMKKIQAVPPDEIQALIDALKKYGRTEQDFLSEKDAIYCKTYILDRQHVLDDILNNCQQLKMGCYQ